MRGKPKGCVVRASANRITPADAGKTPLRYTESRKNRDHPRGCGENPNCLIFLIFFDKSPPRMRGKPSGRRSRSRKIRITPADAGKTMPPLQGESGTRDHPRGCGENDASCASKRSTMGSPPRMRGKHLVGDHIDYLSGITPADAGKTGCGHRARMARWDHPRRCGEN